MATHVGKVIRIVDPFTLIINAGDYEVSVGDTIQIYESFEPIQDLDGTELGDLVYVKDELEVVQVEPRYAICKKDKTITKTTSFSLALSPLLEHTYTEKVSLPVKSEEFTPFPSFNKVIHVGDNARKL